MQVVTRFAPSPNGELHLGHARSALIGHEIARASNGRFLLRIEDIDIARTREAFVEGIHRDLAWLGLAWQEPVMRQSTRFAHYATAVAKLRALGVLHACVATRAEIQAAAVPGATDPDGAPLYPGSRHCLPPGETERRMAAGDPFAWRLDVEGALALVHARGVALTFTELCDDGNPRLVQAQPRLWGNAVLVRKDVPTSYHLTCVLDDHHQGVTMVTRGQDLAAATHLHRLLQALLGLDTPHYHHHALILDIDGRKLSKSQRAAPLYSLRAGGLSPDDVRRQALRGIRLDGIIAAVRSLHSPPPSGPPSA
jgi:glutamyl-Q tRNA(Asp) synthetase